MNLQGIERADDRHGSRVRQGHGLQNVQAAQAKSGVQRHLFQRRIRVDAAQTGMALSVVVKQSQVGDQAIGATALVTKLRTAAAVYAAVSQRGHKIALLHQPQHAPPIFADRAPMRRGPQREVAHVAGQVTAPSSARQLQAQGVAPQTGDVGVAKCVNLQT